MEVPVWRGGREHRSLDQRIIHSYRGDPVGRVHQAPPILAAPTAAALRRAAPLSGRDLPALWEQIARAGEALDRETLAGLTPDEHARLVTLATGAPIADARRGLSELAEGLRRIRHALEWQAPGGDIAAFQHRRVAYPDGRYFAWTPVGEVLGFIAPSNHPTVHLTWVLALAMGWTVALRPGSEDPFTPWRVIQALAGAGFPMDRIALLPGPHELVPALVEACDRTVAYGGFALARVLGRDARVLFNGPGRSKVLVEMPDAAAPWLPDFLVESILHDGGRKCTCASAVVVLGEGDAVLSEVDSRLQALPLLDPLDPAARVPAWPSAEAVRQTPAELAVVDGVVFARPALIRCPSPAAPFGQELPAPWATAVELQAGADPLPVLRGSLAVTLLSRRPGLREACLREPSIRKVFTGPVPPWFSDPGAPHQGRLSEFLFTSKLAPEVQGAWTWPGAGPW